VYVLTTGKVGVADANASGKQQFRGIALAAAAAGQAVSVLKRGHVYGFTVSGLNADALVYLSDTAGALGDAAGTMTVNCGRVMCLPDGATLTKVLYIEADWLRAWS
jgi:methyl coenzyme M reductase beta subunit